ncbi:hypothetical protein Xinn_00747 [Xenorhabdus innexi]|uniref:Uncharacterized protein n=1 Tax=Xenorhabdus innexi TaxID=290109 RepID=A0A2G0NTB6_9GAMM|nr:hypothetical protein Xinn_00747 [Xenorhabdus innexi]
MQSLTHIWESERRVSFSTFISLWRFTPIRFELSSGLLIGIKYENTKSACILFTVFFIPCLQRPWLGVNNINF